MLVDLPDDVTTKNKLSYVVYSMVDQYVESKMKLYSTCVGDAPIKVWVGEDSLAVYGWDAPFFDQEHKIQHDDFCKEKLGSYTFYSSNDERVAALIKYFSK